MARKATFVTNQHPISQNRVNEAVDFSAKATFRALKDIVKKARKKRIRVMVWSAIPCTGDAGLTAQLIRHGGQLCRYTRDLGGDFIWEWPTASAFWQDDAVQDLCKQSNGSFASVATSAVG